MKECVVPKSISKIEALQRIKENIHPDLKIIGKYTGTMEYIKIRCKRGHEFERRAHWLWNYPRTQCKQCPQENKGVEKKSQDQFVKEIKQKHGKKYSVIGKYDGWSARIEMRCNICQTKWKPLAGDVLSGCGCPTCANNRRRFQPHKLTHAQFSKKLRKVNPQLQLLGHYSSRLELIEGLCTNCGNEIWIDPDLHGHKPIGGCYYCNIGKSYSKISIEWLEKQSRKLRRVIKHAENGGEYNIPNSRYKVDGYNARSRTVFEFLGDYWHRDRYPDALKNTMERLEHIKSLGYNVVYIWESEFLQGKAATHL